MAAAWLTSSLMKLLQQAKEKAQLSRKKKIHTVWLKRIRLSLTSGCKRYLRRILRTKDSNEQEHRSSNHSSFGGWFFVSLKKVIDRKSSATHNENDHSHDQ